MLMYSCGQHLAHTQTRGLDQGGLTCKWWAAVNIHMHAVLFALGVTNAESRSCRRGCNDQSGRASGH